jgi:MHS family proline/betaine transporter-like MFS transporter
VRKRSSRRSTSSILPDSRNAKNAISHGVRRGIGNLLEWYDFAVFGYFAPYISAQFLPADDPVAGLINTFGVFAAGYLMRPIGGVFFGQIGDHLGRARALRLSIFVMAVPTTLMAFLPTHAEVGTLAPALLVKLTAPAGYLAVIAAVTLGVTLTLRPHPENRTGT